MLTRSKARALTADKTTIIVSPSATGQGIHTKWHYPAGHISKAFLPSSSTESIYLRSTSSSSSRSTSTDSLFSEPHSSSSTSSTSSFSSLSDSASFDSEPHCPKSPLPKPVTPRKLQRSPALRRYDDTNISRSQEPEPRILVTGGSMMERKLDEVFHREWDVMMKARDLAVQAQNEYETDSEDDRMDLDSEEGMREYSREGTEPAEDGYAESGLSSQRPRPLGPCGTEIIDHETFTPESSRNEYTELPKYPAEWVTAKLSLKWQPTERFIS